MQGIHDALPNAAMQLLARDVIRFLSSANDIQSIPTKKQDYFTASSMLLRDENICDLCVFRESPLEIAPCIQCRHYAS